MTQEERDNITAQIERQTVELKALREAIYEAADASPEDLDAMARHAAEIEAAIGSCQQALEAGA